ncbi:MAG: hypothetical protein LBI66_04770 [Burkholderiaceae bacterium]|nr:hypothetical protein [Burkholderiaceae bacterium]
MQTPQRMRHMLSAIALGLMASGAMAMTNAEHTAAKKQIEAEYKAAKEQCKPLKDNAKDVCNKQASGQEKVSKAELEARRDPTPRTQEKARLAKADADYDIAKEKCDDLKGDAKDVCVKDAKAAHVHAVEAAKVAKAQAEPASNPNAKAANVAETRKDAAAETREADFKAAKARCDTMSGAAKDACVADAERRFAQ